MFDFDEIFPRPDGNDAPDGYEDDEE